MLKTLDAASTYLRRIRTECTTVGAGRPADGYGYLGVCNDSNATIEHATRGTISTFPLMRAAELDSQPALGDGLDATAAQGWRIANKQDALRRALAMQPFAADSPLLGWDPALAAQLARAKSDLE